ncbi:MAG: hypothetical protein JW969_14840 [Spirochaetales bacterium]|nr:hypothetical protein [Spirochaetales bacterium]
MYFGIAGLIDDETQNKIRKQILQINNTYNTGVLSLLLPQHVSLKIAFKTDEVEKLENYFNALFENTRIIEIELENIEVIDIQDGGNKSGLIWYSVKENDVLRSIHNKLNVDLPDVLGIENSLIDGDNFRFHTTLFYGNKTLEEYNNIHINVKEKFGKRKAWIDRIALFCCTEDTIKAGSFFTYKIKNLAKD